MTQIRTAEEILKDWIFSPEGGWDPEDRKSVINAMQEYAKQFIDLAAYEAKVLPVEYNKYICKDVISDTSSILKIKDLIK